MNMTEAAWRNTVLELASTLGWRSYCVENSTRLIQTRSRGTIRVRNVNLQGVGFPDLVLVRARDARLIFAELKRGKRERRGGQGGGTYELTAEQETWLADLRSIRQERVYAREGTDPLPDIGVHVWRPEDLEAITRILR